MFDCLSAEQKSNMTEVKLTSVVWWGKNEFVGERFDLTCKQQNGIHEPFDHLNASL